CMQSLEFPFIF
nr:immunoglobulin light chain junction region [Macaca mulatta]MOV62602.1 immunoglobulin light chain junction region [Macaca mulatta]MOV63357.1 immunoglobulin light chain junction region [Macaca mulatta]MOV64481.1 immunoglobulin light chain junction region [Macaca mulatta]MOV64793.1 immunoglobulin light chain junction region [Macaca mulatta]